MKCTFAGYSPSSGLPDGAKKFADPVDNRTIDDCVCFLICCFVSD